MIKLFFFLVSLSFFYMATSQYADFRIVPVQVDFSQHLQDWDGFGVTYVQTAHTQDYEEYPQDYGGFSLLDEDEKEEIIEMIFGNNGLKPGLVKMFLDPLHQKDPGGNYDHEISTIHLQEFVKRGMEITNKRGDSLSIITTLYGPPAWVTLQKEMRGRDLDTTMREELADYIVDWIRYLVEYNFPLKYISVNNEGEDWRRWPNDGVHTNFDHGHDYNLYWSPGQLADFIILLGGKLEEAGLEKTGITPGETWSLFRFYYWGYADALLNNPDAMQYLTLMTSHGFLGTEFGRWFSGTGNPGLHLLKEQKPALKTWITSMSWGKMDTRFVATIFSHIYLANVSGIIPWACIQRPAQWVNNDPNPGTAFVIAEDGSFKIQPGHYFYKQVSRAGQPGTKVVKTRSRDSEILLMGFASNYTNNPDAFVVINTGISATDRSDKVYFNINDNKFGFCLNDTSENFTGSGIKSYVNTDEDGYILECYFPWDKIAFDPLKDADFLLNVVIQDGENSVEGKRQWKSDENIILSEDHSAITQNQIQKNDFSIVVDGSIEEEWSDEKSYKIIESLHNATKENYYGEWKAVWDKNGVTFQVKVVDESNSQYRTISCEINGSNYKTFEAYRTIEGGEKHKFIGDFKVINNSIIYNSPPRSVTTFFGKE